MRNDLNSLNPGKACAQAAHAANCLSEYFHRVDVKSYKNLIEKYDEWLGGDRGFGTTIVLEANIDEINEVLAKADESYITSGSVIDTSYPIQDGKVTHHIILTTCGFLFGPPSKIKEITKNLILMR